MKHSAKLLTIAWVVFLSGITYALLVPVGEASAWILLPTVLLGLPLIVYFGYVALNPRGYTEAGF